MIRITILSVFLSIMAQCCVSSLDITSLSEQLDYRQLMRQFVMDISKYAKQKRANFIIIPQNGHELLMSNAKKISDEYIKAIDGIGREDLFFGYEEDDKPTPISVRKAMIKYLNIAKEHNRKIFVTDYCKTKSNIDLSYQRNHAYGYISFAADSRELDDIPPYQPRPYNENSNDIHSLSDVRNFLYLINPFPKFKSKQSFIKTLEQTNYDMLIIDAFFDESQLTSNDISKLKSKANGGKRLVIAYMSIGEAEDYRYYWKDSWKKNPPDWLAEENPEWKGNYKVRYWMPSWHKIIYGENHSYLDKIISCGFDGVYLDIIDAYEYFEENETKQENKQQKDKKDKTRTRARIRNNTG